MDDSPKHIRHVLLVEDNPGDARLTREAFHAADKSVQLHVATDGVDAIAFLMREGRHIHAPRPHLILLDLNLPKMNGREVIAQIRRHDSLKLIPTIILTTSDADSESVKACNLEANCYYRKPGQLDAFDVLVQSITDLWLSKAPAYGSPAGP